MKRVHLGWVLGIFIAAASVAHAQTLVTDEIRLPPRSVPNSITIPGSIPSSISKSSNLRPVMMPPEEERSGGGYAAADEAVGPSDIIKIIQVIGYEPLGAPVRRNWVYTVSAINPGGDDGRVVVDARTGRIIGFIPAAISNDEVEGLYGPPRWPPMALPNASPLTTHIRSALRPPAPVPSGAERMVAAPSRKPERRIAGVIVPPSHAVAQNKIPEAKGVESKPAETEPPVQLQPTQDMPAMQALD
jgi:hypothetical protein